MMSDQNIPSARDWMDAEDQFKARIKDLEHRLADAEAGAAKMRALLATVDATIMLHSDLNRRAAIALGKPAYGPGSTWADTPEQITVLRSRLALAEAVITVLKRSVVSTEQSGLAEALVVYDMAKGQGPDPVSHSCPAETVIEE